MQHDAAEQKRGITWLMIAGPVAIALTTTLYCINNRLEDSQGEKILGETLRELRTAQTSIESHVTDSRQTNESAHEEGLRIVKNSAE